VDHLLKSIPLLRNKDIKLVIVGASDWKRSNHEAIINELGIAHRIHFTGGIYDELPAVYSMAKVFCFPSYAESFGLPPLEAMACGIPVVVSDTTSLPEVCGPAGTYVRPDQPAEIATAIDRLLADDKLYEKKRELSIEQAKKFTWPLAAEKLLTTLEGLKN
jgi:glycosyltransferase involved in cell wall biosynthesis